MAEGHTEVVEVVFEVGDDASGIGEWHVDPAPVGVGGQVEVGMQAAIVARR